MSSESLAPIQENAATEESSSDETSPRSSLQQVRQLGVSPLGESFEVHRVYDTDDPDDSPPLPKRFVVKKISNSQLRDPDRFQQKFQALRRLDHPHLCPYLELYIGENAARITRPFLDALPLDEFLYQPITDAERDALIRPSEASSPSIALNSPPNEATTSIDPSTKSASPPQLLPFDNDPNQNGDPPPANTEPPSSEVILRHERDVGDSLHDPPLSFPTDDRPNTLEIPTSLLEDSEAADRTLDIFILRLRELLPQVLAALEYLHRFRHVHGDLKPSNILVTPDARVILTDYGIYSELQAPALAQGRFTSHCAPESKEGIFRPASDLYALGSILFEILSGRSFGEDRNDEEPRYLSEITPHCPATWTDLTHGLLEPDPDQRLSLTEVRQQLAESEDRSVNIPATVVNEQETLFGRHEPLSDLTEFAKSVAQRRRLGLALIEGDIGVGKTALVDALARWAAQHGWLVLHGRSYQNQAALYEGWNDIVDQLVLLIQDLPDKVRRRLDKPRAQAALLFPQLLPTPPPVSNGCRHRAIAGFRNILTILAEQRPILFCFDDLHWAGDDSLRFLADLGEVPEQLRVMLAATIQPSDQEAGSAVLKELSTSPADLTQLHIEGFSKQEAREYVLANGKHLTLPQKQRILRKGGFNPLLIEELIHEHRSPTIGLHDDDGNHTLSTDTDEGLHHYVIQFVEQRLSELNRPERLALQLLAVAYGPLPGSLLSRALQRELGHKNTTPLCCSDIAENLVTQRLARRARTRHRTPSEPSYLVIHDLCRSVILGELGRDHHARLCGLIGDSILPEEAQSNALQFEYYVKASRHDEAARAARKAIHAALTRQAFFQARRLLSWLVQRNLHSPQDLLNLAIAQEGCLDHAGAAKSYLDLLAINHPPLPPLELRLRTAKAFLASADRAQALDLLDQSLHELTGTPLRQLRPPDLRFVGRRLLTNMNRWSDVVNVATSPDSPASPHPKDAMEIADLLEFALYSSPLLHSASRRPLRDRFGHLAHQLKTPHYLGRDRLHLIGLPRRPFLVRDSSNLSRWLEQAQSLFRQSDDCIGHVLSAELHAHLAIHRGQPDTLDSSLTSGLTSLAKCAPIDPSLGLRLESLALYQEILRGESSEATHRLQRLEHRYRHHRLYSVHLNLLKAQLALLTGTYDTVEPLLAAIDTFIGDPKSCLLHLEAMQLRTQLCVALGKPEVAIAHWDLLRDEAYPRPLLQTTEARLLLHQSLAIALTAQAHRETLLNEPRLRQTLQRLHTSMRALSDLTAWMGALDMAQFHRLQARVALLHNRPARALKTLRKAARLTPQAWWLPTALNNETRGYVLTALEDPSARQLLQQTRDLYRDKGFFLPLLLEGWPVPRSHSLLKDSP